MAVVGIIYLVGVILAAVFFLISVKLVGGEAAALEEMKSASPQGREVQPKAYRNVIIGMILLWPLTILFVVILKTNISKED